MNLPSQYRWWQALRLMALLLFTISPLLSLAAPLALDEASARARTWMENHPLMGRKHREIRASEAFPAADAPYAVHVIRLAPAGYLILNSDDRLPLVVAFSEDAALSLDDTPGNALRAFLAKHVIMAAQELASPQAGLTADSPSGPALMAAATGDELIEPLMDTSWNQCHPYNLLAPADPSGSAYYGFRAPTGCVPTAFAQVLHYQRWPVRGVGSHAYTDDQGTIQGNHSADFSDPYDWGGMLRAYDSNGSDPEPARNAVAELMHELGVAAEADFDSDGTSSSIRTLASQLGSHFHFGGAVNHSSQATLLPALHDDLRAGHPVVLGIPGHAVIADGLLTSNGSTIYHINYGWGGANNGWWAADGVPGGAITDGITSLIPKLMPFPVQDTVTTTAGSACELQWLLPKRREQDAGHLKLYRRAVHSPPWTADASTLGLSSATNWQVVADGKTGSCWFAGPNGPATLDLQEIFIPEATTTLQFWLRHRLGSAAFTVSVSEDDGGSFNPIYSRSENYQLLWERPSIPLAAYAGKRIRLRLELGSGSYYAGSGGVWVDELAVTPGSWESWETLADELLLASRRFSSVVTPWDEAGDFTNFTKTSTSTYKDWTVGTLDNGGTGFYKEPGGYTNKSYHLTSANALVPAAGTRLRIYGKYSLASDAFRVLVSTDQTSFTSLATFHGSSDWQSMVVDLSPYAGQAIHVRLEYLAGSYFSDGGVWIDSLATEQVENPELEGQPLHLTVLGNLQPGTYQVAAAVIDAAMREHPLSPAFTLQVDSAASHSVVFQIGGHGTHAGGGALVQSVPHGGAALAPLVTPVAGWRFTGWDTQFQEITTDLVVSARFDAMLAARGTPHWWLIGHGLVPEDAPDSEFDLAEASDPLAKGLTLREEFLFGTDPNDPSSRFQIERLQVDGNGVSLHWTGCAGRTYRVLRSPAPAGAAWQEIASFTCDTDQMPMTYTGNPVAADAAFYRLGVSLAE